MKGILFKPWKIKAIAANPDKEWQTRRVIKPQPPNYCDSAELLKTGTWNFFKKTDPDFHAYFKGKPRYHVGEVVYIKESWRYFGGKEYEYLREPKCVIYRNDVLVNLDIYEWNNPRTMPAWAARYFIKITEVKACRTKDIAPLDCIAEGIYLVERGVGFSFPTSDKIFPTGRSAYFALFDNINGAGSHEQNWVWKYSFVKVDRPVEFPER